MAKNDAIQEFMLYDMATKPEYRQFLRRFQGEYIYELLRLGREVTPFRTLEHIAGVHHVAMSVSRAFKAGGGLIDLGLMSGAAAGHDLGKFGFCKKVCSRKASAIRMYSVRSCSIGLLRSANRLLFWV